MLQIEAWKGADDLVIEIGVNQTMPELKLVFIRQTFKGSSV